MISYPAADTVRNRVGAKISTRSGKVEFTSEVQAPTKI